MSSNNGEIGFKGKHNTVCNIYVSKLFNSGVFEKRIKFPQEKIFRTKHPQKVCHKKL